MKQHKPTTRRDIKKQERQKRSEARKEGLARAFAQLERERRQQAPPRYHAPPH